MHMKTSHPTPPDAASPSRLAQPTAPSMVEPATPATTPATTSATKPVTAAPVAESIAAAAKAEAVASGDGALAVASPTPATPVAGAADPLKAKPGGLVGATLATPAGSTPAGATPRRRKLVRGGNAKKVPVLPEYTQAVQALKNLDAFLDRCESLRPPSASPTPPPAPSTSPITFTHRGSPTVLGASAPFSPDSGRGERPAQARDAAKPFGAFDVLY